MATKEAITEFFDKDFPESGMVIDSVGNRSAVVKKKIGPKHLRPGGTVSGPVLMEVADAALYIAILGELGLVLLAVTTNLNINFLRRPPAEKDIIAECRLIKVGKTQVVGEVSLYSEGLAEPVAHAIGTYSIPQ